MYGIVLRDYPKQVASRAKAQSVSTNMREFLSWAHRHYRIDVSGRPACRHLLLRVQVDVKSFVTQGSNAHSIRLTCKICGTVRKEERHPQRQDSATCSHRHTDHKGSNAHTRKTYCVDCGTYIDLVPREIFNALEATRSVSSNRDEELANRVLKDTTITKQQLDLATRMMLEQVPRFSDGDSMVIQHFLDCVDLATASSTPFVSLREKPMHFNDNQTLNLRVVDPIADVGVWAIIDDGCNSCCHGRVWRQNVEAKKKVLRLHPIWVHRTATTPNGVGTSTTSGKLNIPMTIRLQRGCVRSSTATERIEGKNRMSSLWSKGTLGKRSRMRNVFLQFICTKSDTHSSYGDTTTTCQSSESGRSENGRSKHTSADRNDRRDTLDSDSSRRC